MSKTVKTTQTSSKGKIKFILGAVIGAFLFLAPIPITRYGADGETVYRLFNIPLGVLLDWINPIMNYGDGALQDVRIWLALAFITLSFLGTVVAWVFKPKWIMENTRLKEVLLASPLYAITRLLALIFFVMVLVEQGFGVDFGPLAAITDIWDGGGLMVLELIPGLVTIFLFLSFAIPVLTDFGLMEFIGVMIKKFVTKYFRLPGRASVDLAASWFGSSAISVIITRDQHEKGFYTGREAAVICANFAFVSLPFSFVIARQIGIESNFALWYLVICIVCIILGIVTPRLWPLKDLDDNYLPEIGKQIDEEVEAGESRFAKALDLAATRAEQTTVVDVIKGGFNGWVIAFLDLFPVIMAWATIALVINATTPIFDWIAWPFGLLLDFFQVPGGANYAAITVIGFVDMFLPAVFLGTSAPFATRFILGALSIVQIVYMAETGILILKSRIPLGLGKLFAVFVLRTVIALPLIVWLTYILTSLGWIG